MGVLTGKTILVTGASSGFGEAIAIACAQAGANVSLVARRKAALEAVAAAARAQGGQALVCPADVSDDAQVHAAVEKTRAAFGPIDILVNNAGANIAQRSIADTTAETVARIDGGQSDERFRFHQSGAAGDERTRRWG